jgi:cell division septum initiation protein DivIVA
MIALNFCLRRQSYADWRYCTLSRKFLDFREFQTMSQAVKDAATRLKISRTPPRSWLPMSRTRQHAAQSAQNVAHKVADAAEDAVDSGKQAAQKMVNEAQDVAEDVADKVHDAARRARRTASEAIDSTGRHMRNIDDSENPLIDNLANRAQDLAERSINFWADSSHRARRQFNTCR